VTGDEEDSNPKAAVTYLTDPAIQFWLSLELEDEPRPSTTEARKALVQKTLLRWQRFGDAEIHLMPDGQPRWRASMQLLERLYCQELKASDEFDEENCTW
jgi:hypothetical protein